MAIRKRKSEAAPSDFLRKYNIEFPDKTALSVIHAEPVSIVPNVTITFSEDARKLVEQLIPEWAGNLDINLKKVASLERAPNYSIIFFLDQRYHIHEHIFAIRSSIDEIAILGFRSTSTVLAIFVRDFLTLVALGKESPFLGQLVQIADAPQDDCVWVYFLGRAKCEEASSTTDVEVPVC